MKNNICEKLEPLLFWYLDNSLNPKQLKKVEQHLQACEHCRNCLTELKQVNELLSGVKPVPSPAGLDARIREKIRNSQTVTERKTNLWGYARLGAAAALLLFVVAQLVEQNNKVIPRKHEITTKVIPSQEKAVQIPASKKTEIIPKKQIPPESEKPVQLIPSEVVSIPSPLEGEGQGEVNREKLIVSVPEEPKKEIKSVPIMTTKDDVVQNLVDKGVPIQNAQQTVTSAISRGYTVDKLNQIVTNPKSSTVSLSPKRTMPEQSGSFKFEEAAPNPFTPNGDKVYDEIFFKYQNPEELTVKIKIYNLNDVVVRNLEFTASETASWNGTNEFGELLESGIYLYTLQAGEVIIRGTIILAK